MLTIVLLSSVVVNAVLCDRVLTRSIDSLTAKLVAKRSVHRAIDSQGNIDWHQLSREWRKVSDPQLDDLLEEGSSDWLVYSKYGRLKEVIRQGLIQRHASLQSVLKHSRWYKFSSVGSMVKDYLGGVSGLQDGFVLLAEREGKWYVASKEDDSWHSVKFLASDWDRSASLVRVADQRNHWYKFHSPTPDFLSFCAKLPTSERPRRAEEPEPQEDLTASGDRNKAIEWWKEARELGPDDVVKSTMLDIWYIFDRNEDLRIVISRLDDKLKSDPDTITFRADDLNWYRLKHPPAAFKEFIAQLPVSYEYQDSEDWMQSFDHRKSIKVNGEVDTSNSLRAFRLSSLRGKQSNPIQITEDLIMNNNKEPLPGNTVKDSKVVNSRKRKITPQRARVEDALRRIGELSDHDVYKDPRDEQN